MQDGADEQRMARLLPVIALVERALGIDENVGATAVPLSADEVALLDALAAQVGVQGDRYNQTGMAMVGL